MESILILNDPFVFIQYINIRQNRNTYPISQIGYKLSNKNNPVNLLIKDKYINSI